MRRSGSALLSLGWVLSLCSGLQAQDLRVEGHFFRDAEGGVVLLRGLNVAGDSKVPPFRPIDDPSRLDRLPEWGVNVARLLFTWEAFEPERGRYDESYFRYYLDTIDALHARGTWVVVDVHQDAFSRFATDGCGEGMPEWAVSDATQKHTPDNGPDCSSWGIKFIVDTDTHRCWDDFYADDDGVRTRYLALLDVIASRLADHPAVIGYDMLNEPWADERKQLGPLYADAARTIRAVDPDGILFVSPRALTSSGQDTELDKPSFDNFAYAPHFYDGGIIVLHAWAGGDVKDPVQRMKARADAWGVPLFVGEFGAPAGALRGPEYMDAFYAALDEGLISSAQWSFVSHWDQEKKDGWNTEDFSIVDENLKLRDNYRMRPYPARVAGEPRAFGVREGDELSIVLSWEHDPALGATRVFAPPQPLFSAEAQVDSMDDVACELEFDRRHVRCAAATAGSKQIVIRRCQTAGACLAVAPAPAPEPAPEPESGGQVPRPGDGAPDAAVVSGTDPVHGTSPDGARAASKSRAGCGVRPREQARADLAAWLLLVSWLGFRQRGRQAEPSASRR